MFSPKKPTEVITLTFDFTALTADTVVSAAIDVTVNRGTDANPSAILDGLPQISGRQVLQKVAGGIDGAYYDINCTVQTIEGNTLVLDEVLPIIY